MSASSIASRAHVQDVFTTNKPQKSSSARSGDNISPTHHPAPLSSNRYVASDHLTTATAKYDDNFRCHDLPKPAFYEGEGNSEYSTPVGKGKGVHSEDVSKEKDAFEKVASSVEGKEGLGEEEEGKGKEEEGEEDGEKTVVHHEVVEEKNKDEAQAEDKTE